MKWLRVMVIVVATIATVAVALESYRSAEPHYQGRTLSDWINDAVKTEDNSPFNYNTHPAWLAASNAVNAIGDNALPVLSEWARANDSKAKSKLILWLDAHPSLRWHIRPADERQWAAYAGFKLLGKKAKSAGPVFVKWTCDARSDRREWGLICLASSNSDKENYLPVLQRLAKDPDKNVQRLAAGFFQNYYPQEAQAAGIRVTDLRPEWNNKPTIDHSRYVY